MWRVVRWCGDSSVWYLVRGLSRYARAAEWISRRAYARQGNPAWAWHMKFAQTLRETCTSCPSNEYRPEWCLWELTQRDGHHGMARAASGIVVTGPPRNPEGHLGKHATRPTRRSQGASREVRCYRAVVSPGLSTGETHPNSNVSVTRAESRGPAMREALPCPPRGELSAVIFVEKDHGPGGNALLASHEAKVLRGGRLDAHL